MKHLRNIYNVAAWATKRAEAFAKKNNLNDEQKNELISEFCGMYDELSVDCVDEVEPETSNKEVIGRRQEYCGMEALASEDATDKLDYIARMSIEKNELRTKMHKLTEFIGGTKFDELPVLQQCFLRKQLDQMIEYYSTICARLDYVQS